MTTIFTFLLAHWGLLAGGGGILVAIIAAGAFLGPAVLLKFWKPIVGVLLLAALFFAGWHFGASRARAADATTITTQKEQIGALQSNVATLTGEISKQNAAISALGTETATRQKAASDAMAAATRASTSTQVQIAVLKAKNAAPAAKELTCETAIADWRAGR